MVVAPGIIKIFYFQNENEYYWKRKRLADRQNKDEDLYMTERLPTVAFDINKASGELNRAPTTLNCAVKGPAGKIFS